MQIHRRSPWLRGTLYVLAAVCVAAAAWSAYGWIRPRVTTTTIVMGPVIRAVYATGTISPIREFPIRARRAGTLERVLVDKGDRVTAGQPLAAVADASLTYAVDRARAELTARQARADAATSPVLAEFDAKIRATGEQLEIARRDEARLRRLFENGSGSSTDLDRSVDRVQGLLSAHESFKAQRASMDLELAREVATAQAALRTADFDLAEQTAQSPIDGVVLDRPVSQGTRVAVNEVLMRVADVAPERLVMRAAVDEEDVTRVVVGQKVVMTLYAFEGDTFEGRVRTIYAEADANRRTFEVDVEVLAPSDRFQPGMTGELAFVVAEKPSARILPSQSVQGGVVYVVEGGRVARSAATIGVSAVDRVEVTGGLADDAQVIVSAVTPAMVGSRVRATPVDPRAAVGLQKTQEKAADSFKGMR